MGTPAPLASRTYFANLIVLITLIQGSMALPRPVCTFILPSTTSPLITDVPANGNSASRAKHEDPGHYVCAPTSPPRGLLVFVPGLAATDYTLFARASSETGLAVVVISSEACSLSCCGPASSLNCSATDPASAKAVQECYHNDRLMHLVGKGGGAHENPAHYPTINQSNSIVGRTKALLSYLSHSGNKTFLPFGDFLHNTTGELVWTNTTVAGHSCASYYPILMAARFPVQRMVMTGGAGGSLVGFDLQLQLPKESIYGFVMSTPDCGDATKGSECARRCAACDASGATPCTYAQNEVDYDMLGLPGQAGVKASILSSISPNDTTALATALGGARQLFDRDVCVYPGRPIMTHLCQICDLQTHIDAKDRPVLAPVWRYLVANQMRPSATAMAHNVTCNDTARGNGG